MLANPLCRLGVSLASLRTQLPCGSRCAPASNPFLPPRQLRSTNPKFIPPAALVLRQQRCLGHTTNPTTSPPLRFASSSATSPEPPTTTATPPPQAPTLSWNDYLALRKSRRRYNLVASIITSLGTTSVGVTVLGQQNFDQLGGLFGLDPIIVLIAATASSGAVGWLLGPFVGNAVFGMVHRGIGGQIAEVSGSVSGWRRGGEGRSFDWAS